VISTTCEEGRVWMREDGLEDSKGAASRRKEVGVKTQRKILAH